MSRSVTSHGGISVGDHVRLRAEVLAELRVRGISREWLERHALYARVAEIAVNDEAGWNSARVVFVNDVEDWFAVEDLERVPTTTHVDASNVVPCAGFEVPADLLDATPITVADMRASGLPIPDVVPGDAVVVAGDKITRGNER